MPYMSPLDERAFSIIDINYKDPTMDLGEVLTWRIKHGENSPKGGIDMIYVSPHFHEKMVIVDCKIVREEMDVNHVRSLVGRGAVSCCNHEFHALVEAIKQRFSLSIPIIKEEKEVFLYPGDSLVVIRVNDQPPVINSKELDEEKISFVTYTIKNK